MSNLTNEIFLDLITEITQVTLDISQEDETKAYYEFNSYLENKNKNIHDMNPFSIYLIIKNLDEQEQINFIKKNINYIKEKDEEVFLYDMIEPKALSYFLSWNVLKEIRKLDLDLFKKLLNRNYESFVYNLNQDNYLELYSLCFKEITELQNMTFLSGIYFHDRLCYNNINYISNINNIVDLQHTYNKEFINFLLNTYQTKISTFTPSELLKFITYIKDIEVYKKFIKENFVKINHAFDQITSYDLKDYLSDITAMQQDVLINNFFHNIIKKQDIKKIIMEIDSNIILNLYNKNKDIYKELSLKDWIKYLSRTNTFNKEFQEILDKYEINNIESLLDINYVSTNLESRDLRSLKYIEMKYRNNFKITKELNYIDDTTSIFSEKYLKNLKELKYMLKEKKINKNNSLYQSHIMNFILYLKKQNIINDINNDTIIEIEKLFYRIVMGSSITILYKLSNIEEITLFNRIGKLDFNASSFTVEQLKKYNVKLHKILYQKIEKDIFYIRKYKELILKLMFILGFNYTKKILEIDNTLPTLEHLVGNVNIKNIKLNNDGNPILNTKIIRYLFNNKDYSKIIEILRNKDNDLYKYFPRIFNEWNLIKMHNKDKSLKTILEFLKTDEILLPPKYYRLMGLFKYIGCNEKIVKETFLLHDLLLNRAYSTIPRIKGISGEYSYEVLKLNDLENLVVGNKTNCCFTILGNGYSSLKHAITSNNGRILVVKKNNQLIAHSWIWRNGNLLCLDNIETSNSINEIDFLDIYLKFAEQIINKSQQEEGNDTCIKNITIGINSFDKKINGIKKYPCLIKKNCDLKKYKLKDNLGINQIVIDTLPQPLEKVSYSDSRELQYLISGNGIFNLKEVYHYYKDERNNIMHYQSNECLDNNYLQLMNNKINALRYIKSEKENTLNSFTNINIENFYEAYCNDDWYILYNKEGNKEVFLNSSTKESKTEIKHIETCQNKNYKKIKVLK